MNKELFEAILIDKIDNKNYAKGKVSKNQFYNVNKRVQFYKRIVEPVKFLILNVSEKEFEAVKNMKLKTELPSKKQFKSFSHIPSKPFREDGQSSERFPKKASSDMYAKGDKI